MSLTYQELIDLIETNPSGVREALELVKRSIPDLNLIDTIDDADSWVVRDASEGADRRATAAKLLQQVVRSSSFKSLEYGLISNRPSASSAGNDAWYLSTDEPVLYRSDGTNWIDVLGGIILSDRTVNIPSDYATLQEAIDTESRYRVKQGVTIDLLIESGHQPESGVEFFDGDYRHITISSEDAEVLLPTAFNGGRFINGANSAAPVLNCLVDSQGNASRGYSILGGSGLVNSGCGVKNTTGEALWIYHCVFDGNGSVWSGSTGYAIRASRGTIFNCSDADFTNCNSPANQNGIIYVNRGSIGNIQFSDMSGCVSEKLIYCHRSSKLNAHNLTANTIESTGLFACFVANRASELDINSSTITDVTGSVAMAIGVSAINMESMEVPITAAAGNSEDGVKVSQTSRVNAIGTILDGFGNHNVSVDKASAFNGGSGTELLNAGSRGISCSDASVADLSGAIIDGSGSDGAVSLDGSTINVRDGSVINSTGDDLICLSGSFINANGTTTTNGTGSPDSADTTPSTYNSLSGRGVIWA